MKQPPAPSAATSIFERMSLLAREKQAINLGQGFPDLPESSELIEAAARALHDHSNQYPPMRGLPELRRAVAAYYRDHQQLDFADDEIVVTSGATEALAASILALVRPGDEVILVQPLYDAYLPLVTRAGGIARFVDLEPPNWTLPYAALEAAISSRTRAIILNTPNNPTGTVLDRAALDHVAALCERHDIYVICDEVWEAMLFNDAGHLSPMHVAPLRNRTVKIGSAGKLFSLTGWKVGWACAAPALASAIAAQHQFLTFTTPPALQWAAAYGLGLSPAWHDAHRQRYAAARDRLVTGLTRAGFSVLPNAATWFVTIDLAASGLDHDDVALSEKLIEEAGIASIPVSAFYAERPQTGYLRLCFAKEDATIDKALAQLATFRERSA